MRSIAIAMYCLRTCSHLALTSRSFLRREYHVRRDIPSTSHNFRLSSEGAFGWVVFFSFFGNSLNTSSCSCSVGLIPKSSISVAVLALYTSSPLANLPLNVDSCLTLHSLRNCKPFSFISFCASASNSARFVTSPPCIPKFTPQNTLNSRWPCSTSPRLSLRRHIKCHISPKRRSDILSKFPAFCPLDTRLRFNGRSVSLLAFFSAFFASYSADCSGVKGSAFLANS